MATRIEKHVKRGAKVHLTVNDKVVTAFEGETLASVLLLQDQLAFYKTESGKPRAPFCNMGACYECRTQIEQDGRSRWVLACMTPAEEGMSVTTGLTLPQLASGLEDPQGED